MAIFFPDIEPDREKSNAEYACFMALRALPDSWVVLHSVYIHSHGTKRSAEADFVLISDRVILVLEVKGGRIARREGKWIYINRNGHESEKKESPFQQAEGALHAIRDRIKVDPDVSRIMSKIGIGWGCYLPDVNLPEIGATEWPSEMVCDAIRTSIESLPTTINSMERYIINRDTDVANRKGNRAPSIISKDEKAKLVSAIRKDFESLLAIRPIAAESEDRLLRMTDGQADVFWGLAENNSRVLVFGPAGTGKTIIAHRHFNTLAEKNPGIRVGLVCFNTILSDYLCSINRSYVGSPRAFVGTVYQLLREACPSLSKDKSDLSKCVEESKIWAAANPDKLIDCLIIDEGQDLRPLPEICFALGNILRDGWSNGNWAWFEDKGQSIIRGSLDIFEPPFVCKFELRHNVRNTERIADTANVLAKNHAINAKVYGLEVDYRIHAKDDSASRYADLNTTVLSLLKSKFSAGDIVILDYSGNNEFLAKSGKIANLAASPWSLGVRNDTIRYTTCRKFKGMESRAVVVYNVNGPLGDEDPLLYVAVTRPIFSLTMIMDKSAYEDIARIISKAIQP